MRQLLGFVTAAVVGVILNLTIYLAKAVLFTQRVTFSDLNLITLMWILISFIALYRFKINMIVWIGVSALFGLLRYFIW